MVIPAIFNNKPTSMPSVFAPEALLREAGAQASLKQAEADFKRLFPPGPRSLRQAGQRAAGAGVSLGSDQSGRNVLVVTGENVVEQRKVRTGPLDRRTITSCPIRRPRY